MLAVLTRMAQGFSLGGSTQFIVTGLIYDYGPMSPAWYVFGAAAIGQIALMLIPESAPARMNLPLGAVAAPAG